MINNKSYRVLVTKVFPIGTQNMYLHLSNFLAVNILGGKKSVSVFHKYFGIIGPGIRKGSNLLTQGP